MAAARQVSSPAVYYLIDRGANIEATDDEGRTALWWAARAGNYIALEILLRHGADPNKADRRHGITPLIIASRVGHVRIVRMLLEYGVDASKRDRLGQTALDAARRGKHEEHRVIERLLQEYIARQERKKKEDNNSHPVT